MSLPTITCPKCGARSECPPSLFILILSTHFNTLELETLCGHCDTVFHTSIELIPKITTSLIEVIEKNT